MSFTVCADTMNSLAVVKAPPGHFVALCSFKLSETTYIYLTHVLCACYIIIISIAAERHGLLHARVCSPHYDYSGHMITFFHLPFLNSLYACVLHVTDTIYLIVIKCLPQKTTVDVGMVKKLRKHRAVQ